MLDSLIRLYQRWPYRMRGTCRYIPTCSEYALQALRRYGTLRGGWMALRRILRCHPFAQGGYDPVPERPRGAR